MTIYLDYMATTPLDPQVLQAMLPFWQATHGSNAASQHRYGRQAQQAIAQAKSQVLSLLHASHHDLIWTSGATESNNLALQGVAHFYQRQGRHIISCETEHKAVLDTLDALAEQGFDITLLKTSPDGLLDLDKLRAAIRPDTILVSVMHVNNEIGVIQDIDQIAQITASQGVLLHVDAAQSAGKVTIDCQTWPVDLLSLSAHKVYGPQGVGALCIRREPRVRLIPLMYGGGHQHGLRSGTLPTALIVGMGQAFAIAEERCELDAAHAQQCFEYLLETVVDTIPGVTLNGHRHQRVPHNVNIHVHDLDGEALLFALREFALSTTSACHTASMAPSHVLTGLGLNDRLAQSSLRISWGRFTHKDDVVALAQALIRSIQRLRSISEDL